jgi:hypothetical protein
MKVESEAFIYCRAASALACRISMAAIRQPSISRAPGGQPRFVTSISVRPQQDVAREQPSTRLRQPWQA